MGNAPADGRPLSGAGVGDGVGGMPRPGGSGEPGGAPAPAGTDPEANVSDDRDHPVKRQYVLLQRVVGWILCAILTFVLVVGLLIALLVTRPTFPVALAALGAWLGVSAAVATFGHVWPALEHRHLSYRVSDRGIQIQRGVLWRQVVTIPRNRIQHTDVSQGPLERQFGLATLLVHTAGTEFARVSLPGLEHSRALAIRDHLVEGGEDDAV